MEQYTDSQYDDDLTIGVEDAEESFDTGFVDLFEYSGDEDSPIARLKSLVLSIDWEINDQVLTEFNDELLDLKDIWGADQIKLVYVQALEKISKYIYQQKSNAHPNAIKLLLNFYYDLEKIVTDEDLSDQQKKELLRQDVRKFEQLKKQIAGRDPGVTTAKPAAPAVGTAATISEEGEAHPVLFNLKACILGMDWEITDRELRDLGRELKNLEERFAGDKPKMLFLQGIGALGGYIKLKKSNAHADAFKLLYSFYEGLEKIVVNDLSLAEQKEVLLPEVEKFEAFKKIVAPTIAPEAIAQEAAEENGDLAETDDTVAPAFADVPEDVHGFRAEEEAETLGEASPIDVEDRLDSFFGEEPESAAVAPEDPVSETAVSPPSGDDGDLPSEALDKIESFFGAEETAASPSAFAVSAEEALKGVDVETEADDDSDEEALPTQEDGKLAPALADSGEEHGFVSEEAPVPEAVASEEDESAAELEDRLGGFFDEEEAPATAAFSEEVPAALQGVDVETEADDDSDEPPLPIIDEEVAPALFGGDESEFETTERVDRELFGEDDSSADTETESESLPDDLESRLDSFFTETEVQEDVEEAIPATGEDEADTTEEVSLADAEVESEVESEAEVPAAEDQEAAEEIEVRFGEPEPGAPAEEGEEVAVQRDISGEFEAELFRPVPEDEQAEPAAPIAEEADFHVESDALEAAGDQQEGAEDEITFEAVVDEVEAQEEDADLPTAVLEEDHQIDDELSSFGGDSGEQDFFAAIDERVEEPGEFQMELLDEADEFTGQEEFPVDETEPDQAAFEGEETADEELVAETAGEDEELLEEYGFGGDDQLADLRAGIASLGVEINETIIDGILAEINELRQRLVARPVDKTFLQLLSTIVQHIGQYGYESSAEAHGLLLSVFDKLELIQNTETDGEQAQEILLAETCKVLLWQQRMLDRQAVKKGDQLTFVDPIRADESAKMEAAELVLDDLPAAAGEQSEDDRDFNAVFEPVEEEERDGEDSWLDDAAEAALSDFSGDIEDDAEPLAVVEESPTAGEVPWTATEPGQSDQQLSRAETGESITEFLRREIEALKLSLHEEIRSLREQIKDRE